MYKNNGRTYISKRLYANKSYISNNLRGTISEYKGVFEGYDYDEFFDNILEARLSESFFKRRLKMLGRPDSFMLSEKLGVELFSKSLNCYIQMWEVGYDKSEPHFFYMISDNPSVSLRFVDCSLYTRRIALKDGYHKKLMDLLAYGPVQFIYLETPATTSINPSRQNLFIQEKTFNNAPVRPIVIAMKTNGALNGFYTENPIWFQQVYLSQIKHLECTSVWFDLNARCYWKISILRTSRRTT